MLFDSVHCDLQAEENVIVALCVSKHAAQIFRELTPEDFFHTESRERFEWLAKAYAAGNLREAVETVKGRGLPTVEPIPAFTAVAAVRNHSIRRRMIGAISEVGELCGDYSEPVGEVQSKFKELAIEIMDARVCKVPSETVEDLRQFCDEVTNDTRAFVTGITEIDRQAAIQPGDFLVLAARPGVGKSALGTGFLLENFLGRDRHRGVMFCIEMDRKQTYSRLLSQMTQIRLSKFLNVRDYPMTQGDAVAMSTAVDRIRAEFPTRWFQQGVVTLSEIEQVVELERPEFVMIDYVQLIKHFSRNGDYERLSEISMRLRQLALDYKIAVIATAQLNRDADGVMPTMAQIKGSGQFEQDATHVFLLDRPESERSMKPIKRNYFDRRNVQVAMTAENGTTNNAALLVAKNRNGPNFYELLRFNPDTTAFTPYE